MGLKQDSSIILCLLPSQLLSSVKLYAFTSSLMLSVHLLFSSFTADAFHMECIPLDGNLLSLILVTCLRHFIVFVFLSFLLSPLSIYLFNSNHKG